MTLYSNFAEEQYSQLVTHKHKQHYAQFFTPYLIAKFMTRWVVGQRRHLSLCDPASGMGVFFRATHEFNKSSQFHGFDIDPHVLKEARKLFKQHHINATFEKKDFLLSSWKPLYDGMIANPPYLKFQQFKNRHDVLNSFKAQINIPLSGFSNIYSLFLVKALNQLKKKGRLAFLVPSEFLNADYGVAIKKVLINSGMLRSIILFDIDDTIFDKVLTTSCIVLCENTRSSKTVTFHSIQHLSDLSHKTALHSLCDIPSENLEPTLKWRHYYETSHPTTSNQNLVPFSTFAKAVRGIATGDNHYFTFDIAKQKQYKIHSQNLMPCISKSATVTQSFFTTKQYNTLKQEGHNVQLFNASLKNNKAAVHYVKKGLQDKVHLKYLTSRRQPWHKIEERAIAPIWVSVFNRGRLKFVRNESMCRHLTTFHGVYMHEDHQDKADLFFAYLITDVAQEILKRERRSYGGGLDKFEPGDLNKAFVFDLNQIDRDTNRHIKKILKKWRAAEQQGDNTDPYKEKLNQLFSRLIGQ